MQQQTTLMSPSIPLQQVSYEAHKNHSNSSTPVIGEQTFNFQPALQQQPPILHQLPPPPQQPILYSAVLQIQDQSPTIQLQAPVQPLQLQHTPIATPPQQVGGSGGPQPKISNISDLQLELAKIHSQKSQTTTFGTPTSTLSHNQNLQTPTNANLASLVGYVAAAAATSVIPTSESVGLPNTDSSLSDKPTVARKISRFQVSVVTEQQKEAAAKLEAQALAQAAASLATHQASQQITTPNSSTAVQSPQGRF